MYFIDFICYFIDNYLRLFSESNKSLIMNAIQLKEKFQTKKILCSIFGHKLVTTRNVTAHFKEYKCTSCQLELTNDDKGMKTFLTPELRDVNETLMNFYQRRHHII